MARHAYDTALGTVRFLPDKPLSASIIKAIVSARAKEIELKFKKK